MSGVQCSGVVSAMFIVCPRDSFFEPGTDSILDQAHFEARKCVEKRDVEDGNHDDDLLDWSTTSSEGRPGQNLKRKISRPSQYAMHRIWRDVVVIELCILCINILVGNWVALHAPSTTITAVAYTSICRTSKPFW